MRIEIIHDESPTGRGRFCTTILGLPEEAAIASARAELLAWFPSAVISSARVVKP